MCATRRMLGILFGVGLSYWFALLAGCSPSPTPAELYLERLAGVLDQSVPDPLAPDDLQLFPSGTELAVARTETKLGVLDVPALHRCELGSLVGARNGVLGRVQTFSQRFLYDVALLKGLQMCADLGDVLAAVQKERAAELGVSFFNALFAGEEWHAFVTPSIAPVSATLDEGGLQRAFAGLQAMAAQPVNAEVSSLEEQLRVLRFSRALGSQREVWRDQSQMLESATNMLARARQSNPGCRTGKPTPAGQARRQVFELFYVQGLQPQLAAQGQVDRGWLKQVQALVQKAAAAVVPEPAAAEVLRWHEQVLGEEPQHEYGRWQTALAAHTKAWQWQLRACGLMPGLPHGAQRLQNEG